MLLRDRFDSRYFNTDVLFRYHAGWAGLSHTRASGATLIDRDGILREVGPNVPRIDWSHGRPALRLEPQRTNLVAWSSKLSQWTKGGTPTVTDDAIAFGALSLALVRDPTAGVLNYVFLPVTFTGDGQKCVSVYLAQGPNPSPTGTDIVLRNGTAGVDRLRARVTWSAGAPVVTMIAGTAITAPEHVGQGIYRLQFRSTAVTAANSHTVQIEPARTGETGDVYAGGVQVENAWVPSSLIVTEGTAATRATDTVIAPWAHGLISFTGYVRFIETGGAQLMSATASLWFGAGGGEIWLRSSASTPTYVITLRDSRGVSAEVHATPGVTTQVGQLVELMPQVEVSSQGVRARLIQAVDGGVPVASSWTSYVQADWVPTAVRLASRAGGSNQGQLDLRDLIVLRGADWTMDAARAYLPEW